MEFFIPLLAFMNNPFEPILLLLTHGLSIFFYFWYYYRQMRQKLLGAAVVIIFGWIGLGLVYLFARREGKGRKTS